MKDLVVLKNDNWVWPKNDVTSWQGQNDSINLVGYVLPYVKDKNVMVQAGGNCGFILSQFVPYFKKIYTFEPDPVNFYCLNHVEATITQPLAPPANWQLPSGGHQSHLAAAQKSPGGLRPLIRQRWMHPRG